MIHVALTSNQHALLFESAIIEKLALVMQSYPIALCSRLGPKHKHANRHLMRLTRRRGPNVLVFSALGYVTWFLDMLLGIPTSFGTVRFAPRQRISPNGSVTAMQIIELLAYALVLSGNHVFTSGALGTNAATIR